MSQHRESKVEMHLIQGSSRRPLSTLALTPIDKFVCLTHLDLVVTRNPLILTLGVQLYVIPLNQYFVPL